MNSSFMSNKIWKKAVAAILGCMFFPLTTYAAERPGTGRTQSILARPHVVDLTRDLTDTRTSSTNLPPKEPGWMDDMRRRQVEIAQEGPTVLREWPISYEDTGGTLLFSDSPEYVNDNGILYQDTVVGPARVLYYHLNNTASPRKVAVVLQNDGKESLFVHISRQGYSAPNDDYLTVGKQTQDAYFNGFVDRTIYVPAGGKRLLDTNMDRTVLAPGELVYGMYDFSASKPVKVSVLMYDADANPLFEILNARVLPKDEQKLRGTFHGMNRIVTGLRPYDPAKDGPVFVPLSDNVKDSYIEGIDATDGEKAIDFGNYGLLYKIRLPLKTGTRAEMYLTPLGGIYAGAMLATFDDKKRSPILLETPGGQTSFGDVGPRERDFEQRMREQEGRSFLKKGAELAFLGTFYADDGVTFEFSPPGASNLPVEFVMMPKAGADSK